MKNASRKLKVTAILLTLSVIGLVGFYHTSEAAPRDGASGQGSVIVQTPDGRDARRIFAISAHRKADGTVQGNAILHNPAFTGENDNQRYQLQVDISCMNVIGNIAFFGGTTRRTNDPNLVDAVYFSVQDNGEPGKNNDRISSAFFFDDDPTTTGDPQLCMFNQVGDFPMFPIEAGNINLR